MLAWLFLGCASQHPLTGVWMFEIGVTIDTGEECSLDVEHNLLGAELWDDTSSDDEDSVWSLTTEGEISSRSSSCTF